MPTPGACPALSALECSGSLPGLPATEFSDVTALVDPLRWTTSVRAQEWKTWKASKASEEREREKVSLCSLLQTKNPSLWWMCRGQEVWRHQGPLDEPASWLSGLGTQGEGGGGKERRWRWRGDPFFPALSCDGRACGGSCTVCASPRPG